MEKPARAELHPDHIVLAESLEYLVEEVLEWCKGAWARARDPIGTSGHGSSHSTRSESSERVSYKNVVGSDLEFEFVLLKRMGLYSIEAT